LISLESPRLKTFKILILFILFISARSFASEHLGFRWGGPDDDRQLLKLSVKLSNSDYRITDKVILDTIHFMDEQGWTNRSSGAGIYYSSDLTDSLKISVGRSELFIFLISDDIQIGQGALGLKVRNYYLNQGEAPPMISRYTDTFHVIARVPNDREFAAGTKIIFHPATEADGAKVFQQLKMNLPENRLALQQTLTNLLGSLVKSESYQKEHPTVKSFEIPPPTQNFMRAFAEQALIADTTTRETAKAVLAKLDHFDCKNALK
jgi:hypothetical protein